MNSAKLKNRAKRTHLRLKGTMKLVLRLKIGA